MPLKSEGPGVKWWAGVLSLFLVPTVHPILIPYVGVPSHLLWWFHVLPVALISFRCGRRCAALALAISAVIVAGGEAVFGAGYGVPATPETVVALTVALTATNLLVGVFALYAREVSNRYRLLFSSVAMGVVQMDAGGRIVRANPAALDFFGDPTGDGVLGKRLADVISADLPPLDEFCLRGGWSGEVELTSAAGARVRHVVLAAARAPDADGYQVLIADRSTEAMQEQEIERQTKLASLGEALAGVAHELNNPLASIVAHAQLATMELDRGDDATDSLDAIQHDADRMRRLVGELLGFSRSRGASACTDVGELVARVARVQRIALGKRVEIVEDLLWSGSVLASPMKVEQILLNLISNAAYAVREAGGSSVTITVRREGSQAAIAVADDGPGIDPQIVDRLFEPFQTTKPEGEGTGLGLAISRRLARSLGGDLTASDGEFRGAVFTLSLPLASVADVDCGEAEEPALRIA